ncbi:MAG: ABC transporter permease [Candidatus Glassbacteria bacterium]|nr:ABC transporter permease [Candidatus Glassbacteria bacterium]
MTLWRLVIKEIKYQKLNFALGLCSVFAAVCILTAQLTVLKAHDRKTEAILAANEAETAEQMALLEDDYRKIMKKLGFNLLILPGSQNLEDYYSSGFVEEYMPEEYVPKLAGSGLMTIRHLLPSLKKRVEWPEQGGRSVVVVGIRGEVPITHRQPSEPIQTAVAPGEVEVGFRLARELGLEPGHRLRLLGEEFTVSEILGERGTKDDFALWIDLATAQRMFDCRGKINAILALKCLCPGNQLSQIRQDVAGILPATQVIEVDSKVVTRAEARQRAAQAAQIALAAEQANRLQVRTELERFAVWLAPVVILGAALWIGLLFTVNVRQRRNEIAILRALGVDAKKILLAILAKAALIGVVGALPGYLAGFGIGVVMGELEAGPQSAGALFSTGTLVLTLVCAPFTAVVASWLPALAAVARDPAEVLRQE